jgi:hypothetical protein
LRQGADIFFGQFMGDFYRLTGGVGIAPVIVD